MDYYDKRRRAINLIDKMFRDGKRIIEIQFKIETLFGFGEKIVNNRLNKLNKLIEEQENDKD